MIYDLCVFFSDICFSQAVFFRHHWAMESWAMEVTSKGDASTATEGSERGKVFPTSFAEKQIWGGFQATTSFGGKIVGINTYLFIYIYFVCVW